MWIIYSLYKIYENASEKIEKKTLKKYVKTLETIKKVILNHNFCLAFSNYIKTFCNI